MPLNAAEILAVVEEDGRSVDTVKLALVAPSGTVTVAGTLATAELLDSAITAPPTDAAPVSLTVPVADFPPRTLVGLRLKERRLGPALTASTADLVVPAYDPEIVTDPDAPAAVETLKSITATPAGTITLTGTVAMAVLLLASATATPPGGAAPSSVTQPVDEVPPRTVSGLRPIATSVTGCVTLIVAVLIFEPFGS